MKLVLATLHAWINRPKSYKGRISLLQLMIKCRTVTFSIFQKKFQKWRSFSLLLSWAWLCSAYLVTRKWVYTSQVPKEMWFPFSWLIILQVYPIDVDEHRFTNDFERTLYNQFYRRMSDVIMSWFTCKKMFKAPRAQSFHIFQNPVSSPELQYQRSAKCLMDCTMRRTGVVSTVTMKQ